MAKYVFFFLLLTANVNKKSVDIVLNNGDKHIKKYEKLNEPIWGKSKGDLIFQPHHSGRNKLYINSSPIEPKKYFEFSFNGDTINPTLKDMGVYNVDTIITPNDTFFGKKLLLKFSSKKKGGMERKVYVPKKLELNIPEGNDNSIVKCKKKGNLIKWEKDTLNPNGLEIAYTLYANSQPTDLFGETLATGRYFVNDDGEFNADAFFINDKVKRVELRLRRTTYFKFPVASFHKFKAIFTTSAMIELRLDE